LAGGWPAVSNLVVEELGTCEEIRQIGGDSGQLRSIPWTGKKRAALRSFSAHRRGWGRHGTATLGGSHGGHAQYREETWKRGRVRTGERERKGVVWWRPAASTESSRSVAQQAGGGRRPPGARHAGASLSQRRRQSGFCRYPPGFGEFLR
jgi:hypothetical protein